MSMFQRLGKGFSDFLDNKIDEENEKQRQQQLGRSGSPAKRTPSTARRGSGRIEPPIRRAGSKLQVPSDKGPGDGSLSKKGPDPDDFVIGDDASDISRVTTPAPTVKEGNATVASSSEKSEASQDSGSNEKGKDKAEPDPDDKLPLDVQQKLARLETLTTRYQDLLRNYRTAHAQVTSIEPFEATLREHTPLTSISDPGALVEFLNQRTLQSDMVKEELKRISGEHNAAVKERDELKVKLDKAEKKAKEAFDEAAGLRRDRDEAKTEAPPEQVAKPTRDKPDPKDNDAFFSYEDELSRAEKDEQDHKAEIEALKAEREVELTVVREELSAAQDYINELSTENASMRHDLDMIRLDLSASEEKLRRKDDSISALENEFSQTKTQLEQAAAAREAASAQEDEASALLAKTEGEVVNLQSQLKLHQQSLDESKKELVRKAAIAEENLKKHQEEHQENLRNGKYVQRDEKLVKTLQDTVSSLKEQRDAAIESRRVEEGKNRDLTLVKNTLESEAENSATIISDLRRKAADIEALRRKLTEAQHERDDAQRVADTKKGHEASAHRLRQEVKSLQKERDQFLQMIIDCGKCKTPDVENDGEAPMPADGSSSTPEPRSRGGSDTTDISTQPTELSTDAAASVTTSAESNELAPPGEAKKKPKKKKSKAKRKTATDTDASSESKSITIQDLLHDPELATEQVLKSKFPDNPMLPLVESMLETMKNRDEAEGEHEGRANHLEEMVERSEQAIRDKNIIIQDRNEQIQKLQESIAQQSASEDKDRGIRALKTQISTLQVDINKSDVEIQKLRERLRGEAVLKEELETITEERDSLQEDVLEHGKAATDAKHELKEVKERRAKLQAEFDDLQTESDGHRKRMADAEAQKEYLTARCASLEGEVAEFKTRSVSNDELDVAKEQLSNAEREKAALQLTKEAFEKQIEELKAEQTANGAEVDSKQKTLSAEMDTLRTKSVELEKELAAANQLAQTRFKDLTDLRELYNKVQPELKRLREESAELKTAKVDLEKNTSVIKRLEAKEKDLRSEIAEHKSQAVQKDTELASLREKSKKGDEWKRALEDSYDTARKDLEKSESIRNEALETRDRLQVDLRKLEEELKKSKPRLEELEQQVKRFSEEASGLRDELQLKTAQQASAQSLMDSMQDQTRELATQMKELKERNDGLEEELEESRRLLSERSREGDTMKRLLSDVEVRADAKVKEMREKMDLALEERDRAEDEASSIGRRKAREVEDLKIKLRDAEREASRAKEAREDSERRERDFKAKAEDLERRAAQGQEEVNEVRSAMGKLSDSLDETERQSRELEKERAELRKTLSEREARLEKLQKSSKSMAEELRTLQQAGKTRQGSTRTSMENSRVTSPAPAQQTRPSNGSSTEGAVDYVYLKNILLQFLEQKEKKHQMQLVPVLGMLLHFDRADEQKWMAAISAK